MNIVALEQLWAFKDAETVAEHARFTALTKQEDLPKLQKKWARGEAIRQAYRQSRRALAGQPKPEKPKKPVVHDAHITAVVRRIEDDRTKASHQKQDAKLQAKRAAKQLAEDAKIAAKRAAEDERRVQSRVVQAAKRAECRKAADVRAQPPAQAQQPQAQQAQAQQAQANPKARVRFQEAEEVIG